MTTHTVGTANLPPQTEACIATEASKGTAAIPWEEARAHLAEARSYWLATIHPKGHPHVRPVLAVWLGGRLYSTSNPTARKGRNLAHDHRCVLTARTEALDVVVEGYAAKVSEGGLLQRVADAYITKYEWPVVVRNGAFEAPYGAPTAGPPPYEVYEIKPEVVYGFGTDDAWAARSARWTF
jgi:nitroimidazol reductase NimA-like FMN-containing flavoprotein (pyridoxamine 5'-phosphate oxidase superfamily)